jgi:uncharacterized membrane protein
MQQQTENPGEKTKWLAEHLGAVVVGLGVLGVVAGLAVLAFYRVHFAPPVSNSHAEWGTFGDFFGGTLNPIFGFLGLIALLLTLWVQSRELALSRKAMEQSAASQAAAQAALERQAELQKVQLEFELARLEITRLQAKIQAIEMASRGANVLAANKFAEQTNAVVEEMVPHIGAVRSKLGLA